ncbi:MAG TPA: pyruvate, phosphate dikinase [Planctomycetota bacterium]|nr:pyruvate, phosphate dikinase [Planctomycetota bacterium]
MAGNKMVYFFGGGKAEGNGTQKNLLGGKGAGLAEMTAIGIPVPPGFTITTETCAKFYELSRKWPDGLEAEVEEHVQRLEKLLDRRFGDAKRPLLVSVRSGGALSMPGMMDTVLNLGINDDVVQGLIDESGNERFAWDAYRRFIDMFGDVVMGVEHDHFEHALHSMKEKRGVKLDNDLTAADLKELVSEYKAIYRKHTNSMFPTNPREQMKHAINAVFMSWNSERAEKYRQIHKITGLLGTAVNIVAMVFGNMGDNSGTGVAFTRNPSTGTKEFFGEFLVNAQGEDVVKGIRTPQHISELAAKWKDVYEQLNEIRLKLERHYKDMQDIEFTIQDRKLFMLQTRNGKRTGPAAVRIAVDLVAEGIIDSQTAVMRVPAGDLVQCLLPVFDAKARDAAVKSGQKFAKGLPAGPGAATGRVYFTAEKAEHQKAAGEKVILVRLETSPEDIGGMFAAEGILTSRGGMTSHAAVVARQMGKCCVVGCAELQIDYKAKTFSAGKVKIKEGDWISVDGASGEVFTGQLATAPSPVTAGLLYGDKKAQKDPLSIAYNKFMSWVEENRKCGVRANADTPDDATYGRALGAEGIGLCRTEHMFFNPKEPARIQAMREMILAGSEEDRKDALAKLLPFQRKDFVGIFKAMHDLPVTIRLLDPPLHEFLPHHDNKAGQAKAAKDLGVSVKEIQKRVDELHEFNPMLGFRGCRLGVQYPEISEMQVRAIIEAAIECKKKHKVNARPEIMIPLTLGSEEYSYFHAIVKRVAAEVIAEKKCDVSYMIGTMIEIPRAALTADKIAQEAEFFSFGTNDLTQMTMGLSRDDSGRFLPKYVEKKLMPDDPFQSLDQTGVGQLIEIGIAKGRKSRPALKVGICGEHGGDPESVKFCVRSGMNYVSCSPFRVPISRLAAAQSAIEAERKAGGK